MKIIDRYLGKTVISTILLVLLLFIGLGIFISLIIQLNDLGMGEYGIFAAVEYVLLDLPKQIYMLFPVATLIGVMLGLGLLANHNELTVMRASGVSINQIAFAVLKAAVLVLIIATIIGEWVAPYTANYAENHKTVLTSNGQSITTRQGTWIRDGKNFIYIQTILDNSHLEGITRYQLDDHNRLLEVSYAQKGAYEKHQWHMQNIASSKITSQKITSEHAAHAYWNLAINPKVLRISTVDPDSMTLVQLYSYIRYLKNNNLNTNDYTLTFWQRAFQPLATIVMILLAIPFVFGSLRNVSMSLRLMIGIMVGLIFSFVNQFFGPFSIVYQWPPLLAALLPILLFALFAFWLLKRAS